MDRRFLIAGVALAVGIIAMPASAQELTFTSSTTCKLGRGCAGLFIAQGAPGAVQELEDHLRNLKQTSGLDGVGPSAQLFARVMPSEENGWQCGPDRADVLRKLGLPADEGCDDPVPDSSPDPDPVVSPEPASLILIASGLAGMGGAALRRRRRRP